MTAHLVALVDEVVDGDERLVDDDPAGVLRPLYQQVGHLGNGHVHVIRTVKQICKQGKT